MNERGESWLHSPSCVKLVTHYTQSESVEVSFHPQAVVCRRTETMTYYLISVNNLISLCLFSVERGHAALSHI